MQKGGPSDSADRWAAQIELIGCSSVWPPTQSGHFFFACPLFSPIPSPPGQQIHFPIGLPLNCPFEQEQPNLGPPFAISAESMSERESLMMMIAVCARETGNSV